MKVTMIKTQDAQTMGEYKRTAIDDLKERAEFKIICMLSKPTIRWKDGRTETVTRVQLKKLQKIHSWICDF